MKTTSCLYVGRVIHHRLRPRKHRLSYRAYWMLLDLDEIDDLSRRLKLFSHNHFNLFGFRDIDHGSGAGIPLRTEIDRHLEASGLDIDCGPIKLLAMPRLLGYVFNPLSIYFCYRPDGALGALLYEVHNTFGERHSYLIAAPETRNAPIRQTCAKRFHVSPFLGLDMRYDFSVVEPGEDTRVVVRGSDEAGDIVVASLAGKRMALTDANLLRLFVSYPLLTLKVSLGIHWEALLLWLKGLRLYSKPPAPTDAITVTRKKQGLRRAA